MIVQISYDLNESKSLWTWRCAGHNGRLWLTYDDFSLRYVGDV